jgi:hypothetical protein
MDFYKTQKIKRTRIIKDEKEYQKINGKQYFFQKQKQDLLIENMLKWSQEISKLKSSEVKRKKRHH